MYVMTSPGFRAGYPKKPETRSSGSGRVGLMNSGFFGSENPKKVENSGRVGFQKFGFFASPSMYLYLILIKIITVYWCEFNLFEQAKAS